MNPCELSQIINLYNKMDYDKNVEKDKYNKENLLNPNKGFAFQDVHNSELSTVGYIKFLQQNLNTIINMEQFENFKNNSESAKHIDLSIKYLNAFNECDYKISNELTESFYLTHHVPLYEFLISCYKIIKYYKKSKISTDARRKKLLILLLTENYKSNLSSLIDIELEECPVVERYTSMVVYETSDIETATDVLSNSFHENSVPWKIRDIYVQEKILEKFTTILKSKLKPFEACYRNDNLLIDSFSAAIDLAKTMGVQIISNDLDENVMKPTIVVGQNRSYFDKQSSNIPLIINMTVFRTVKESIDLINRNINLSISLWTENISTAYEFVSKVNTNCIWINSNGIFNTKVPFPFNQLILKNIGTSINKSLGIRELDGNIEFQCFNSDTSGKNVFPVDDNHCTIIKTIFANSIKIEFYIDTNILNKPDEYKNFILLGNYKTIVIPFGITFGN